MAYRFRSQLQYPLLYHGNADLEISRILHVVFVKAQEYYGYLLHGGTKNLLTSTGPLCIASC